MILLPFLLRFSTPHYDIATLPIEMPALHKDAWWILPSFSCLINNRGDVAYTLGDWSQYHSFLLSKGNITQLPNFKVEAFNNEDEIVGYYDAYGNAYDDFPGRTYIWQSGKETDMGVDTSGNVMLNDAGTIVGTVGNITDESQGFVYSGGRLRWLDLPTPSAAMAINNKGDILACSITSDDKERYGHYVLIKDKRQIPLLTTPLLHQVWAFDDKDTIAGMHATLREDGGKMIGNDEAELVKNGKVVDLGKFAVVHSINANGLMVGEQTNNPTDESGEQPQFAVIWINGKMEKLDGFVTTKGWKLLRATSVNDKGEIVGDGVDPEGDHKAFILNPVP